MTRVFYAKGGVAAAASEMRFRLRTAASASGFFRFERPGIDKVKDCAGTRPSSRGWTVATMPRKGVGSPRAGRLYLYHQALSPHIPLTL